MVEGPDEATVRLNGQPAGTLPLASPLTLDPGDYEVRCDLAGHRPFRMDVSVGGSGEHVVFASMTRFSRRAALGRDLLFAGYGQHYLDRPRLGWTLATVEAAGLCVGLVSEVRVRSRRSDYEDLYAEYRAAVTEEEIVAKKAAADDAYGQVEDAISLRKTGMIVAGCAVAVGLLDALFHFPGVEDGSRAGVSSSSIELAPVLASATRGVPAPGARLAWRTGF